MKLSKFINKFKTLVLAVAVVHILTATVLASTDVLSLYKNKGEDNIPFRVENMFPGDEITQDYCVRVSYNGTITVFFKTDIRNNPEYLKLAEVLECTVEIEGKDVYTGLLCDVPQIPHTISAVNRTEDLDYKITVSLGTSVGNDYQDLSLIADFRWWVEIEDDDDGSGSGGGGGGGGGLPTGPDTPVNPPVDPDNPDVPDDPDIPDLPDDSDIPGTAPDAPGTADDAPVDNHGSPDAPSDTPVSGSDGKKPTGELIKPPNTGDFKNPAVYIAAICIYLLIIFLIIFIRKKNKSEKNKTIRKLTIALAVVIVLAVCLCVTTFALIYSIVTVDENIFRTGTVQINLNDEKPIIEAHEFLFEPGMTVEKKFFIENESSDSVYYKIYFDKINGGLADVLDVKIWDKESNTVLYDGKARELTVDNLAVESDELYMGEKQWLYATFHFPEESGNFAQNMFLEFDMCAAATQTLKNPNREF